MPACRLDVGLPVRPWFADHCFLGRPVLAAVEIMDLLAAIAASRPAYDVRRMAAARFIRFLDLPHGQASVAVQIDLEDLDHGMLRARLLSRRQFRGMARVMDHAEICCFTRGREETSAAMLPPPFAVVAEVEAERVYRELVPFGPAYRTLKGPLLLSEEGAWGRLHARVPVGDGGAASAIGSPFPLDGAMHAACVHGQRLVDFVPFPVAFARRTISRPTAAGEDYGLRLALRECTGEELTYDIQILDRHGRVCESVEGLRMRDVSGGKVRPPSWIRRLRGGVG